MHTHTHTHTHTQTAILRIYENRHGISGGRPFFETWAVDGVATIEIGGTGTTINFSFDCNTTTGDGETITWDRQQGSHSFAVLDIHQGKRLSMESVSYTDLDVYVCTDPDTGDQISINVTISKCQWRTETSPETIACHLICLPPSPQATQPSVPWTTQWVW